MRIGMNWLEHSIRIVHKVVFRPSGESVKRRRACPSRFEFGPAIEIVEERLCLSVAIPQLEAAEVSSTIHVGADGSLYYRLGNQQDAGSMRGLGGVALEGGGTDVDQAFQWMIGRMGGKGDFLILRSTDSPGYDSYIYNFGGVNSVSTLVIPNRAAALDPTVKQIIDRADAIFIGGGSQNEYLDWWKGTPVQQAISADVARGVPIGGTSAGTDVLTQFIYSAEYGSIRSTQAMADPFDPNMTFDQNLISPGLLPFLKNTIVDTHFENRDRTGRMISFLARVNSNGWSANRRPMGIGINQETALLIAPNGVAQIVGNTDASVSPAVDFFMTPGFPEVSRPGQPLTYTSILQEQVAAGGTFNLSNWPASFAVVNSFTTQFTDSVVKGRLTQTPIGSTGSTIAKVSTETSSSTSQSTAPVTTFSAPTIQTAGLLLPATPPSNKKSFAPTSFNDSYASVPGTVVSLRDAVIAANNSTATGTVTINLKAGTYLLTSPQDGNEDGTTGDLIVSNTLHTLVINGTGTSGAGATMIDASLLRDRILQMLPGTTVILNNLILTGGIASDDGVFGNGPARGGAILDKGKSLTLNNVWVVGNKAVAKSGWDAQGGGIYSDGGTLALFRSTIATNTASGGSGSSGSGGNGGDAQGGGIYAVGGTITLGTAASPDKIESNYAVGGYARTSATGGNGGNAQGGGMYVGGGSLALTLNMTRAVFSSNFAQGGSGSSGSSGSTGHGGNAQGAGLYVSGGSISAVVNSNGDAFQSNRASGGGAYADSAGDAQGAGIYLSEGVLNLARDVLSKNVALGGSGGGDGDAQGAALFVGGGTLNAFANRFAENVALGGAATSGAGTGGVGQGGGLYASAGSLSLSADVFTSNIAYGGSGGDVDDSTDGGNGGGGAGGGLYVNGNSILLKSVGDVFASNKSTGGRGGNGANGGSGGTGQGGAALLSANSLFVKGDLVISNSAVGGIGGQAGADGQGGIGGPGQGGGFFVNRESPQQMVSLLYNSLISNKSQGGFGGGAFSGGVGGAGGAGLGGGLFHAQVQPALGTDYIMCNSVTGGQGGLARKKGATGNSVGANEFYSASPVPVAVHPVKLRTFDSAGA